MQQIKLVALLTAERNILSRIGENGSAGWIEIEQYGPEIDRAARRWGDAKKNYEVRAA